MNEKRALSFTLMGNPVTKKNAQAMAVNRKTGKTFPVQSKSYKEYEKRQLAEMKLLPGSWRSQLPLGPLFRGQTGTRCRLGSFHSEAFPPSGQFYPPAR